MHFLEYNSLKEEILLFLQTEIKNKDEDPDQKWITIHND